MNTECHRIADQLCRAFERNPWHGSSLRDLLQGVTAEQAFLKPVPSAHSIWELVLHIEAYAHIAFEATEGIPMPELFKTGEDWFVPVDETEAGWMVDTRRLFDAAGRLTAAIEQFPGDENLINIVPGRTYNFYHLFHGVVQHSIYHAGQIALLKKAL